MCRDVEVVEGKSIVDKFKLSESCASGVITQICVSRLLLSLGKVGCRRLVGPSNMHGILNKLYNNTFTLYTDSSAIVDREGIMIPHQTIV